MPNRRIDFSDIPELSDAQLRRMKRVGRPTIGVPYQSLINDILARAARRVG